MVCIYWYFPFCQHCYINANSVSLWYKKTTVCFVCSKSINSLYEEYVLQGGDFDERVFLGADADAEIGTPAKSSSSMGSELRERMVDASLRQHVQEVCAFDYTRFTCYQGFKNSSPFIALACSFLFRWKDVYSREFIKRITSTISVENVSVPSEKILIRPGCLWLAIAW